MKLKSQLLLLQDQNFASMCGGLSRMAGGVSESKLATFANACFPTGCYSGLLLVKFILCFLKGAKAERTTLYVKGPTLAGFLGNSSLESPSRLCVRRLLAFDKLHFTHCPCLWCEANTEITLILLLLTTLRMIGGLCPPIEYSRASIDK